MRSWVCSSSAVLLLLLLLLIPLESCEAWSYSQDIRGHCRCDVGYCSCETDPERAAIVNPASSPGYDIGVDLQYFAYTAFVFGFFVGAPVLACSLLLARWWWQRVGRL